MVPGRGQAPGFLDKGAGEFRGDRLGQDQVLQLPGNLPHLGLAPQFQVVQPGLEPGQERALPARQVLLHEELIG